MHLHPSISSPRFSTFALVALLAVVAAPVAVSGCNDDSGGGASSATGGMAGGGGEAPASTGGKGSGGKGSGGQGNAGESNQGGEGGQVMAQPSAVSGKVVDGAGKPLAEAKVLIDGHVLTTTSEGTFEADDVPDEYDLIVLPKDAQEVTVWQDVTRRDPTAIAVVEHEKPSVRVQGTIVATGGFGAPFVTEVGYLCADGSRAVETVIDASIDIDVSWKRWGSAECRLMVRRLTVEAGPTGDEITATEFGSVDLVLRDDGGPRSGQDVALAQVTPLMRPFVVANPGANLTERADTGPFYAYDKVGAGATDIVFEVNAPEADLPVFVNVEAGGLTAEFSYVGPTGAVNFHDAVAELSPALDAVVPRDQALVATRQASIVESGLFDFRLSDASGYVVHVYANQAYAEYPDPCTGSVVFPDLAPLGVELEGEFDWQAEFADSPTSTNAALGDHAEANYKFTSFSSTFSWQ